ncbi:MAG: hypothetical protein ACI88A_001437 [Paraglaciecola sp.]|jgi:hypothetical protein
MIRGSVPEKLGYMILCYSKAIFNTQSRGVVLLNQVLIAIHAVCRRALSALLLI